jgi:hypothetical protein
VGTGFRKKIMRETKARAGDRMAEIPDYQAWYAGKDFSNDWLGSNIVHWFPALEGRRRDYVTILEIGSWEGRSAIAFLNILPKAVITCVDTFDRNTAPYRHRVRKIKARSPAAMDALVRDGEQFDIVYVDGSHRRDDVLADSIMAWRLLKVGGTMIWDDLRFRLDWEPSERPADAIALFSAMFGSCMSEVHRGWQLIVSKRKDWPDAYRVIVDPPK